MCEGLGRVILGGGNDGRVGDPAERDRLLGRFMMRR
jgi:hypothetical protein